MARHSHLIFTGILFHRSPPGRFLHHLDSGSNERRSHQLHDACLFFSFFLIRCLMWLSGKIWQERRQRSQRSRKLYVIMVIIPKSDIDVVWLFFHMGLSEYYVDSEHYAMRLNKWNGANAWTCERESYPGKKIAPCTVYHMGKKKKKQLKVTTRIPWIIWKKNKKNPMTLK